MNGKSLVEEVLEVADLLKLAREEVSKLSPEREAEIFRLFLYGDSTPEPAAVGQPWPGLAWSRYHYNPGPPVAGSAR